jgi:hypothetical protein
MAKKLLIIGASILGLLVVTVLGLALFLDANLSRSVRVESFRLEKPEVVLLRSASGAWNVSSLATTSPRSTNGAGARQFL